MALAQTTLGNVTAVGAGVAATVYTVGSGQTAYVRSFLIHSLDDSNKAEVDIHIVPTSSGNPGTAATTNRIARLGISTEDTYFFECAYPITLPANGDTIQIYNSNANGAINVLILGDREA